MDPNKTAFYLVDLDFVAAIADVFKEGLSKQGRAAYDWKDRPFTQETTRGYYDALLRHVQCASGHSKTVLQCRHHWAAVAANAMILWRFAGKDKNETNS